MEFRHLGDSGVKVPALSFVKCEAASSTFRMQAFWSPKQGEFIHPN